MRTVSYRLGDLARATINIGKVAENEYTRVQFNAEQIFAEYPAATATLNVINPAGTAYPAVVTREGDLIIWDVTDADLTAEGMGELQLTLTENGVVCKSFIARTRIERSIVASGSTPDPVQNWLDNAAEVLEEVQDAIPAGGTQGQVMGKLSDDDYDIGWIDQTGGGGGGGTSNYNDLSNKPQIAGTTLSGNKTLEQLGIAAASDIPDVSGFYTKPAGGIPSTDLAPAVQTSLGKADTAYQKPSGGIPAADIASGVIPDPTDLIDDTAGDGDTNKVWSADKTAGEVSTLSSAIASLGGVTPEQYGAVGDGTTDDSEAVQAACNAGYEVRFEDNKTYYIPSQITIDHDVHLIGGKNTIIKTATQNNSLNNVFVVSGTLKKTTTLTTDYTSTGNTDNSGNKFTLSDMTDIGIGDIMVITAEDQYYNYSRAYYYLGGTLLIGDIYDGHLYATMSMPFDIENTANVSVKVYNAPTVIIEGFDFVADLNSHGNYKYFITLKNCKNSIVRNCNLTMMDGGINVANCVNTLIESVNLSKSEPVEVTGDGYSILIASCTNTVIQRVMTICSQAGISLSGTIPNFDTFIRYCQLASECRRHGIAMHENSYNIVVEDCTLAGLNVLGTGVVNRCRFIKNNRSSSDGGITFCGSHNPDYAILKVNDCMFESSNGVYVSPSSPQNPVQAYDNIVGLIEINNCKGGQFTVDGQTTQTVLSNVIKQLKMTNWRDCNEVYKVQTGIIIEEMTVVNCTFGKNYWINDHNNALTMDNIYNLDFVSNYPLLHKLHVDKDTYGEKLLLPENTVISLSSNNQSAKYIVCGNNIASNNPNDYVIGSVSGNEGGTLVRTQETGSSMPTLSNDANGNLVYTQKNNTTKLNMYPVGMFYSNEYGMVKITAKLKNTGNTSAATFKPYIAIVDCSTGKVVKRTSGSAVEATSVGADLSFEYSIGANRVGMAYLYCSSAVANSETTFEDLYVGIESVFAPMPKDNIQPYEARRLTGDGTIKSFAGVNNIVCSDLTFHVSLDADYVASPIGLLPSGTGVSF